MTPSHKHKGRILVIDDEPASLKLLFTILTEEGYGLHERKLDLESQLRFVKDTLPDLLLVDVRKPGTDGYQVCASLKNDPTTRAIPVIFISSIDRSINQAKALLSGAVDYVTDPFDAEEVLWRIETHISLRRLRESLESAVCNHGGQPVAPNEDLDRAFREIQVLTQVTGRKHAEEKVRQAARELKKAEEALQSSERNLSLIINAIPTFIHVLRTDGSVLYVNQTVLDYTGLTLEDVQKENYRARFFHPEDVERLREERREALTRAVPFENEQRVLGKDGRYRWFLVRYNPLLDEQGRIDRWYVAGTDITERKQAEEAIHESELKLRRVIDAIPTLAWCNLPDGPNEFLNKGWLEYTGLSPEESHGWGWQAAFHPEDLPALMKKWQEMLASGETGEIEARLRRHDGVYRWFLIRAEPLRDEAGKIVRWYGTSTDIDDRKQAEEHLRRSETFLAEAQQLARIGSFSWRVATDKITWSEQLYRIYEFEIGVPVTLELIRTRVHREDLTLLEKMVEQARNGENDFEWQYRLMMPDESIKYLHAIAHATRDRDGQLEYIAAVQDVTQRRSSEEALAKARSELAHVARVTTLNALTASIAHEVNQPLSGIVTNASTCLRMLNSDPPNVDGARETARRAIRDGNRASDVITRLRVLFSKKELTLEPLDLSEATREVIALSLSDLQRNRVTLRSELADDLPRVRGDRVQLQQVILNLVRNASDAMVGVDDRPRELLIKTERDEGDRVRLSVMDAGVGFRPEAADRLFEAFYTTKNDGMGIGLSVSRSIIEAHQGRVWARPNDGPGATFSFAIPCGTDTKVQ